MDMNQAISGNWLAAKTDLDQQVGNNLTIARVSEEELGENKERKFALHFQEPMKPLLLNKTNISMLISLFGSESTNWTNQRVNVYNDMSIMYAGQLTGGCRIRPIPPTPQQSHITTTDPEGNEIPTPGTGDVPHF